MPLDTPPAAVHVQGMARDRSNPDILILRRADMEGSPARPAWVPLFYALFASAMMLAGLVFLEWQKLPVSAKRDVDAARACQQHIRSKLPPEPGLEAVDLVIQPFTGLPGPRSVLIAYRAKGFSGKLVKGLQRCAFETEADGNFPPFKDLSRAVFRSEGDMQGWKDRFLRGEPVEPLAPDRPECCLPIMPDATTDPDPIGPHVNGSMADGHGGRGWD